MNTVLKKTGAHPSSYPPAAQMWQITSCWLSRPQYSSANNPPHHVLERNGRDPFPRNVGGDDLEKVERELYLESSEPGSSRRTVVSSITSASVGRRSLATTKSGPGAVIYWSVLGILPELKHPVQTPGLHSVNGASHKSRAHRSILTPAIDEVTAEVDGMPDARRGGECWSCRHSPRKKHNIGAILDPARTGGSWLRLLVQQFTESAKRCSSRESQRWTLMNNCMRSHLHLEATTRWKAVARRSVTLVTHRGRRLPIVSVTPNAPNGTRTPILRPVRLHGSAVIAAPSGCGSLALGLRLGTPWTSCVGNPDLQQAFVGWDTNDRNETTLRGSPQFRAPTTVTDLRLGDAAKRQTC
ncbi:hypothetical protein C8F01DRAFT_1233157 [Mycena amicta]|nr:hypothetical protein C8F01DRAFT_1233157 [Mycena amicta]